MKAVYLLDQSVNIHTAPAAWRDQCKPVVDDNGDVTDWIIPKGAIVEGDEALLRVQTGQCEPFDDECAKAVGMTPDQLASVQRSYLAASRGIKDAKDLSLFMAGVIEGYAEGTTDEKPVYKPGPNYQTWVQAKEEAALTEGDI